MVDADAAALARGDDDRAVLVDPLDVEFGAAGERRVLDLAVELRFAAGGPVAVDDPFDVVGEGREDSRVVARPESGEVLRDKVALGFWSWCSPSWCGIAVLQMCGEGVEDRGEPVGCLGRPKLGGKPTLVDREVRAAAGGADVDGCAEAGDGLVEHEFVRCSDAYVHEPQPPGRAVRRAGVERELSAGTQVDGHRLRGHGGV